MNNKRGTQVAPETTGTDHEQEKLAYMNKLIERIENTEKAVKKMRQQHKKDKATIRALQDNVQQLSENLAMSETKRTALLKHLETISSPSQEYQKTATETESSSYDLQQLLSRINAAEDGQAQLLEEIHRLSSGFKINHKSLDQFKQIRDDGRLSTYYGKLANQLITKIFAAILLASGKVEPTQGQKWRIGNMISTIMAAWISNAPLVGPLVRSAMVTGREMSKYQRTKTILSHEQKLSRAFMNEMQATPFDALLDLARVTTLSFEEQVHALKKAGYDKMVGHTIKRLNNAIRSIPDEQLHADPNKQLQWIIESKKESKKWLETRRDILGSWQLHSIFTKPGIKQHTADKALVYYKQSGQEPEKYLYRWCIEGEVLEQPHAVQAASTLSVGRIAS